MIDNFGMCLIFLLYLNIYKLYTLWRKNKIMTIWHIIKKKKKIVYKKNIHFIFKPEIKLS